MRKLLSLLALSAAFNGSAQGHNLQHQVYPAHFAAFVFSFKVCVTLGTKTGLRRVDEFSQKSDNDQSGFDKSQQSVPRRIGAEAKGETDHSAIETPIREEEIASFKVVFNEVIEDCDSECSTDSVFSVVIKAYRNRYAPSNETVGGLLEMFIVSIMTTKCKQYCFW